MPNTKEKLIELVNEADEWADRKCDELECEKCSENEMKPNCVQRLAVDYLITNGVTVQKWIPVTERLPDVGCDVLFVCRSKKYGVGAYSDTYKDFFMGQFPVKGVTHWMPLPQPPKGE